jgi:arylsulfatase A-like enzyme
MHNMLIAAGPDLKRGFTDELPSGNVDLAPTIAKILGIAAPPMDGRVLTEALAKPGGEAPNAGTDTVEATNELRSGKWRQYLKISHVGSTFYLDEGNGGLNQAGPARR